MTDLKFALRSLRRSPGFTFLATMILALGIGANTAIFSVIEGMILRPLAYPDAGRLVSISMAWRLLASQLFEKSPLNPGIYLVMLLSLGALALAASCVPAWRGGRVEPLAALRQE